MLIGIMKALDSKPCEFLNTLLTPLLAQIQPILDFFLNSPQLDTDTLSLLCTLLHRLLKSLQSLIKPFFHSLAQPLLNCFMRAPLSNSAALRVFTSTMQVLRGDPDSQ